MRSCPICRKLFPESIFYCPVDGTRLVDSEQDLAQASSHLELGNRVRGSYELKEVLAEGGMGIVFMAEHIRLGRQVAMKVLRSEFAGNKRAIHRFFREARAVNEIKHDNIIEITDFIEDTEGENSYVMELLEGQTLKALLAKTKSLPVPRALGIGMQVANALAAVHKAGIVHRDLKSENIFLIERNNNPDFVKLLDFGVAKLIRPSDDQDIHQTVEGTILGTPEYMSPEQASGKQVDFLTDVYALGVVLYEMLASRRPITGKNFSEIIFKQLTEKPERPSHLKDMHISLPLALEELVMPCLEKDPALRPRTMEEVEARLCEIGKAGSLQCETPSLEISRPPTRSRRPAVVLVSVLLLLLGLGTFWLFRPLPLPSEDVAVTKLPTRPMATADSKLTADPKVETRQRIEILFESAPAGASVYQGDSQLALGRTPISLTFGREQRKEKFRFHLRNHKQISKDISLGKDSRLWVALDVIKSPHRKAKNRIKKSKPPRAAGQKPLDMEGTVNPFDEE